MTRRSGHQPATRKVLDRTGIKVDDIDVFEVNEAFAAQALAVARELDLPPERTNPNGSGISLGHPIGAILAVKSLYELNRTGTPWPPCASAADRASPPSSNASDIDAPRAVRHK
jgi:acetyl-CoA acetyltransferase